jgi:hypothetical protein
VRFTARARKQNYTQIFTAGVEVSGSMQATRAYGVQDEVDYQKQERMRELLRDLENSVINGTAPGATPTGSASVRRTMNGISRLIATNQFVPGQNGFPAGSGSGTDLSDIVLNAALRLIWEQSSGGWTPSWSTACRSAASTRSSPRRGRTRPRTRGCATW